MSESIFVVSSYVAVDSSEIDLPDGYHSDDIVSLDVRYDEVHISFSDGLDFVKKFTPEPQVSCYKNPSSIEFEPV
jgi:hypothetical protein